MSRNLHLILHQDKCIYYVQDNNTPISFVGTLQQKSCLFHPNIMTTMTYYVIEWFAQNDIYKYFLLIPPPPFFK
jgi:hypothetical protein